MSATQHIPGSTRASRVDEAPPLNLLAIAHSWLGTPFVPHACIRRAGVDCVHLCAAIYIELGVIERFDPPRYTLDGGKHAPASLVMAWLAAHPEFEKLDNSKLDTLRAGDLLSFAFARNQTWHVGIFLGGVNRSFLHAIHGSGVVESSLTEPFWAHKLTAVFRPMALEVAA